MTTAIAYTSGKPHIGNTYEIILADAIARYKRAEGYDVYFQTGTDEHGQKIQEKAEAAGISPKEFVDQISGEVKRIWDMVNSSYDNFVRTTDEDHEKCVKKIFKKLYDQGDIYKGSYEGLYCTPCESFWTESQLVQMDRKTGRSGTRIPHFRAAVVLPRRIVDGAPRAGNHGAGALAQGRKRHAGHLSLDRETFERTRRQGHVSDYLQHMGAGQRPYPRLHAQRGTNPLRADTAA